jgi:proliferating cell nuclear antigen
MRVSIRYKAVFNVFNKIVKSLKNFSDYLHTHVKSDGWHIQGMDSSQVTLFHMILSNTWFDEYEFDTEEMININLKMLEKVLSSFEMNDGDELIMEQRETLMIIHNTPKKKSSFSVPFINVEQDWLEVPESAEWDVEMKFKSIELSSLLKKMSMFSDDIKIECSDDKIRFDAVGEEGTANIELTLDNVEGYSIVEGEIISTKYSLKFLTKCLEMSSSYDTVSVEMSKELPLRIHWDLENNSYLRFYIASKMELE